MLSVLHRPHSGAPLQTVADNGVVRRPRELVAECLTHQGRGTNAFQQTLPDSFGACGQNG